jgi:iron complex outermembrane receptor protein
MLFGLYSNPIFAQSGSIQGTITDAAGEPIQFVNIGLEGTSQGATTNKNGTYRIQNVKSGEYTLVASSVGF